MNYIAAQCPKCGRWQLTSTNKPRTEAVFRCKFCGAQRRLYELRKGIGPTPTELKIAYFGPDYNLARVYLLRQKGGGHGMPRTP